MRATSIKAILLAASLIFPTFGFAQTKSKDAAAYANRGIAKLQKHDGDGAIAEFNRALQLDPKLASAFNNRGLAKRRKHELMVYGAVGLYQPDYALGTLKVEKDDLDASIADFNHALQLDPKNAKAYYNRGVAKAGKDDLDGAIADYNRALQLDPKLPGAYSDRGSAKLDRGDADGAIADYNSALNFNPKFAEAYLNRG